jgi:hypothetical protein
VNFTRPYRHIAGGPPVYRLRLAPHGAAILVSPPTKR